MAKNELSKFKNKAQEVVVIGDMGLMPPSDEKLEEVVLGAMLIDSKACSRVYNLLCP